MPQLAVTCTYRAATSNIFNRDQSRPIYKTKAPEPFFLWMQSKKNKGKNKCFGEGEETSYHLFDVRGGKKKV
jgi:hypothetical protein